MKYIKTFESSNYKFFHHMEKFLNQIIDKEDDHRVHTSINYVAVTNRFGQTIFRIESWRLSLDYYSYFLDKYYPYLKEYLKYRIITKENDNSVIDFKEMNKNENLSKINLKDYENFIDMMKKSNKYNL